MHHGAYCALMVYIAPSWCTSTPYTVVVVYNVPWVNPHRHTHRHRVILGLPRASYGRQWEMAHMNPFPKNAKVTHVMSITGCLSGRDNEFMDASLLRINDEAINKETYNNSSFTCWQSSCLIVLLPKGRREILYTSGHALVCMVCDRIHVQWCTMVHRCTQSHTIVHVPSYSPSAPWYFPLCSMVKEILHIQHFIWPLNSHNCAQGNKAALKWKS